MRPLILSREYATKVERHGRGYRIHTAVECSYLLRLLGAKDQNFIWQGSATVWHSYPDGERREFGEGWLCDVLTGAKMRGEVIHE